MSFVSTSASSRPGAASSLLRRAGIAVATAAATAGLLVGATEAPPAQAAPPNAGDPQYLLVGATGSTNVAVMRVNGAKVSRVGAPVRTGPQFSLGAVPHPNGKFIYVSGVASGDIRGFRLHPNGALTPLPGTRKAPGPVTGLVFTPDGKHMYATVGGLTTTIETYAVAPNGSLHRTHRRQMNGPATGLSIPVVSPNGKFLFAPSFIQGTMDAYRIGSTGRLSPVGSQQFAGLSPALPSVTPNNRFLYITNEQLHNIAGWRIAPNGSLTSIGMYWAGLLPHGMEIHPNGRFMYFPLTMGMGIDGRRILPGGALAPLPGAAHGAAPGHAPGRVVLSPDGKWLYSVDTLAVKGTTHVTPYRILRSGALVRAGNPVDAGVFFTDGATAHIMTPGRS